MQIYTCTLLNPITWQKNQVLLGFLVETLYVVFALTKQDGIAGFLI